MTNIKVIGSGYTETSINVNQNLNISNYLRVFEVLGVNNIQINNFGYIGKDLNLFKSINVTEKNKYPIININNLNNLDKDTFVVNNDLNCYYYTTFKSLSSINNTNITLDDNYEQNIRINSDINILNKVISDIEINKITINKLNSSFTKNIIIDEQTNLFNCEVFHINCNNYTTNNLHVLNNSNCNEFLNINIKNNLDISNNVNILGNTNIKQSLIIDGTIKFDNNSRLILPKKSNSINYGILNPGSLRYNDERKSIEYYKDNWYSISSLHSSNYKTTLKIHENNTSSSSNNIEFYQNENLTVELNNNSYNLNIYKKHVNIYKNLNVDGIIKFYPNNISINNNLSLNKNTFINKLLILGNKNTNTNIENGSLRFNENLNNVQLYNNNKWSKTKFYSDYNGINITENNINIFLNTNQTVFNSNTITFEQNLNIFANLNNQNFITSENTNIDNNIVFNNKSLLFFKNNILNAFVAPNYNTTPISNYKNFNINAPLTHIDDLDIHYISNVYYTLADYINYNYVINDYVNNDNLINNNLKFIYLSSSHTNILINQFEIKYFINNTNISNIETVDLNNLYIKYDILVYLKNKLIYNSNQNNIESFLLEKNSYYTIKIRLKNTFSTEKNSTLLFIRLIGKYYVDSYYNNNIDFIYYIDNSFKNNIEFCKDLTILKNTNIYKSINTKNYFNNKIFIDSSDFIENDKNLLTLNNHLNIKNNNIGIGTSSDDSHILKIKSINESTIFNISGNGVITENINVSNNININNNCIVNNINYNNLITHNIKFLDTTEINQNINCNNIVCNNFIFNNNLSNKIHTKSILLNNNNYNLEQLIVKNINISNDKINILDTFRFNNEGNISINSETIYDAFTIGNNITPNLSISHNGYTIINTSNEGFILDSINVFNKINDLKFIS